MACLQGPYRKVKAGYRQRKQQDLGLMPLLGFMCGALWGYQAKAGMVNSNQKHWDFVKLLKGLI